MLFRSYEWDQRYCYPHSKVLINKLGIKDEEKLRIAEREITSLRIANAKISVIKGDFDLLHLKRVHKYIFGDIYEWAGEIRWVILPSLTTIERLVWHVRQRAEDKIFMPLVASLSIEQMGKLESALSTMPESSKTYLRG